MSWRGFLEVLSYGGLELYLFAFAILSAGLVERRPFWSGFFGGILPTIKLSWVLFMIPLLLRTTTTEKKEKLRLPHFSLGYLLGSFSFAVVFPAILIGRDRTLSFAQAWFIRLYDHPKTFGASDFNQSLWQTIERYFPHFSSVSALATGLILGGLLFGRLISRSSFPEAARNNALAWVSPWLLLIQLLQPVGWRWGTIFGAGVFLNAFHLGADWEKSSLRRRFFQLVVFMGILVLFAAQSSPLLKIFGIPHWTELHPYSVVGLFWLGLVLLCL
jgi:hypothetical protein